MGDGIKRAIAATRATRKPTDEETMNALLARIVSGEVPMDRASGFVSIVGRAALASLRQSKAEAAYVKADINDANIIKVCDAATAATKETCEAGAALARTIKSLRGTK